jgi:D-alanyl-D-alanine carboxypeptidase
LGPKPKGRQEEFGVIHPNWKLVVGLLVGLPVIALMAMRFTRRVPPYQPPPVRQAAAPGSMDSSVAKSLQTMLDEGVNRMGVPGMQAYVRTSDGLIWSGVSGTVDLRRRQPMDQDDVLRVGSVTKIFTAVIILKLVEAGQLSLEDPLSLWFPETPGAQSITVRHLLNHTSGIEEIIAKGMMKSIISSTVWQQDELVRLIAGGKLDFAPGSRWEYSNANYILLGMIAERVTGKTMLQLYHEKILDPLNLEHTYFVPYEPAPATLITGYDRDLSHFPGMLDITPGNASWATLAFSSGAMVSTAEDLGVFLQDLMLGDLLSAPAMQEMTTFTDAINPGFSAQNGYGLGLMRLDVDGHEWVGHVGQFMGFTTIAMFSPDRHDTVVITCNLSNPDLVSVLAELQQIIR